LAKAGELLSAAGWGDQDDGLASEAHQLLHGLSFVAAGGHRSEDDVVAAALGGWSLSLVRGRSCSLQAQRPQAPGEVARPVGQASSAPVQEILPSMLAQVVIPQATTKPN
jgi:hypothetical protein